MLPKKEETPMAGSGPPFGVACMLQRSPHRGRWRRHLLAALGLLALILGEPAGAKDALSRVTIAVGGASCLCYIPIVLAGQLGEFDKAGVDVALVSFRGGSQALTAVMGGSADVVMGYFDHCIILAAQKQSLQAFVTFDRFPGLVLAVAPSRTGKIRSVKDLAGKIVGVTAPGSSTDFFLKYLLHQNGIAADQVSVTGIGLDASAVVAQEQGQIDAAVMNDPSATLLESRHKDLTILSDTRSAYDTLAVYGAEYPSGVLYAKEGWIARHENEVQAIADGVVATLRWIHAHTAEEIMAKMPPDMVGADTATYLAALHKTMPMFSETGLMDPKGARAVVAAMSQSVAAVTATPIDVDKTYTNRFVVKADAKAGLKAGAKPDAGR
jgi:NitT/TauT family transport system substrate-binding protein